MVLTVQDKYVQDVYLHVRYDPKASDTVTVSAANKVVLQVSHEAWQKLCRAFLVKEDDEILTLAERHGIVSYLSPKDTDELHCLKGELLAFARAL